METTQKTEIYGSVTNNSTARIHKGEQVYKASVDHWKGRLNRKTGFYLVTYPVTREIYADGSIQEFIEVMKIQSELITEGRNTKGNRERAEKIAEQRLKDIFSE